jgi:hypothetical protein
VKRCVQCQNDLPDTAVHCVYCGAKQPAVPAPVAGPGARTVMGYPGMANDVARQAGGPPPGAPAGKRAGAPNQVSGYDATQPLANDRFRDGRDGFGNHGAAPPAGGFGPAPGRGPQGFDPGPQHGMGGGPQPRGYAPPPGMMDPPRGYGPPQGGPGFGPGPGPQGPQHGGPYPGPQGFGPPQQQGFGPPPQHGFGQPPSDPAFALGPRPGSQPQPQQHGYGPPPQQHGYGPPPQQHGYGSPQGDPAFAAPQHLYGPQPAGSGFSPMHGPGPQQHGYGPPPAGFHPRPETELVAPLRPPYLSAESLRPGSIRNEPWGESLKTLMLVFGVLLIACFVAPWSVLPGKTTFSWTQLTGDMPVSVKIVPILFLATGVLAVLFGALPLGTTARGFASAGIGLAPILFHAVIPEFDWRSLIGLVGAVTLVSGLVVRAHYPGETIGRLLATIGAICVLLQVLIPEGGSVPLVLLFKAIGQGSGQMTVIAIVNLLPVVLALLAFLVWLPPPGRAGAHIMAWAWIALPVVSAIATWMASGNLGDTLKTSLAAIIYVPLAIAAWTALTGYGVATVVGKQMEHTY